jgi:hypothetical protein
MTITATQGQSLIDFAVQLYGDESKVFELAFLNDLPVTWQFLEDTPIQLLELPETKATAVLRTYKVEVRRLGTSGRYVLVDENGDYPVDENMETLEAPI